MTAPIRALFLTDADSYVKWGSALAGQVPGDWSVRLGVLRGNAQPSPRQLGEAVSGTRFAVADVELMTRDDLARILVDWAPDVVVAAARGMAVQTIGGVILEVGTRPVVVSGLPGISVPVLAPGLRFRRCADVFVVHSHRELREFTQADDSHRFELATLPYLRESSTPADAPVRDRIVFAAQAMVPASRKDRRWMLQRLVDAAEAHPDLTVVVKVRARRGEPQTHVEELPYEDLLVELDACGAEVPANLVVESGPMSWHLSRAVGLVTISSSAVLEAVAAGVPCLAIDDFGVGRQQINLVLVGSGLLGSTDRLVSGTFRDPAPEWLDDNYLHDSADNTWLAAVDELLELRARGELPPLPPMPRSPLGRARSAVYRRLSFTTPRERRSGLQRAFVMGSDWEHRRRWAIRQAGKDRRVPERIAAERDDVAPTSGSRP